VKNRFQILPFKCNVQRYTVEEPSEEIRLLLVNLVHTAVKKSGAAMAGHRGYRGFGDVRGALTHLICASLISEYTR
jgi:hypothetical protein